jgi:hypothetical protein
MCSASANKKTCNNLKPCSNLELELPLLQESEGGDCFSIMRMILWYCFKSQSAGSNPDPVSCTSDLCI